MYQKGDAKLYDTILAEHNVGEKERQRQRVKSENVWAALGKE
jgi:hypothetical protein